VAGPTSGGAAVAPAGKPTAGAGTVDRALDKPAFTAAPAELLAAAAAAPASDSPFVVLREQHEISYDDSGRATERKRSVVVVRTREAIEDWEALQSSWRASYQDKPVVRARVIDPGGGARELDPADIREPPARGARASGDRRLIEAMLPTLQIGSVIEQEIATADREPWFNSGRVSIEEFEGGDPVLSRVISYTAPAASRAHPVVRRLPAGTPVRHQVAHGRESWVYEVPVRSSQSVIEGDVPSDAAAAPYLGLALAPSWAAVARSYRARIDQRITEGPVAFPSGLPRTASRETIAAVVGWVQHQVRYTGNDLAQSPVVPSAPGDAVKRGTGGGNDQATLVIALLRQAGIRADLGLVRGGPGRDVDPELPDLGEFDRSLVRARLDGRDLWIDPVDDLVPLGQLPAYAQGRRVLIIAEDSNGLATTPAATSGENLMREVRSFAVVEAGASNLTEVRRATGAFGHELRSQVRAESDLKRALEHRAKSIYDSEVERVASSDPLDLNTPFELTMAMRGVRRVFTGREQVDIYLYPREVLGEVPWSIHQAVGKARVHDFAWPTPHIYEIENRIAVPDGFALSVATPERSRAIGPATFTERRSIDGHTLVVAFRFDTGKARLTPAEFTALRAGVRELEDEEVHLQIENTASMLSHAGKPREAVAECKRLIALHPKEALHRGQLAEILLQAGAGQAARREARAAVALEPTKADPLTVLGWVLQFDSLGRRFTYDWDRTGAIAALRKAVALDPTHIGAATALAEVLTRDPLGRALETGADLPGAIEAWRRVLALNQSEDAALALVQVLLWSGRFAEAEAAARSAAASEARDKWLVAVVAASRGSAAAIQTASELRAGAGRVPLLSQVAPVMLLLQRYDTARELFAALGPSIRQSPAQQAVIALAVRHPAIRSGTADPRLAVFDVMLAQLDPARSTPVFWDAALERRVRDSATSIGSQARNDLGATGFLSDLAVSGTEVQIEGGDGIWRATVKSGGDTRQLYLALDRGIAKLIGATGTDDGVRGAGRYVLRMGDAPAQARARRLLDWLRSDLDSVNGWTWFKALWTRGAPADKEQILLAGAALANTSDPDRTIALASRCASTVPEAESVCHAMLIEAYEARARWQDALSELEAGDKLRPQPSERAIYHRVALLASIGRSDEADHLIDEHLVKQPGDHDAIAARFWIAVNSGRTREALSRGDALANHPNATPQDLNVVAWHRLSAASDLPAALELARKAFDRNKAAYGILNTVAAIEAELGDLGRAVADNTAAMALGSRSEPREGDWYVAGRIYEQLGLPGDAVAAYQRAVKPVRPTMSIYELAQRRLAALRTTP
jgi:tetratricopeptide (TPR) repeat protein